VARAAAKARKASRIRRAYRWVHRARRNSFAGDTPVLIADGSYRPIAQIRVGDYVVAVDPETGERSSEPVQEVFTGQGTKELIRILLAGDDADDLTVTAGHPLWVNGKGRRPPRNKTDH